MSISITKTEAIHLARSGKAGRDKVLELLYRCESLKGKIQAYVLSNSGSMDDALQVHTDTIMQFVKVAIRKTDLTIESTLEQYLMGIAKYVWLKQLRKTKVKSIDIQDSIDLSAVTISPEDHLISDERHAQLGMVLDQLGAKCREVLLLWGSGYRMREIAQQMGYKSEQMAKKKKYECSKAMMKYLSLYPTIKESLR